MKKQKKEQGITLVALVVTIIILLILTGVTLNLALEDNGLFEKAKEAVEKYKQAEDEEENAINKLEEKLEEITINYNDYVGVYVEYTPENTKEYTITSATSGVDSNKDTNGNIIADNIASNGNQTFKTEDGMKWRIWDYDENTRTIRLISEKPTTAKLTLKGATGYNNGVWAINEICRQCYGQYEEDGIMKEGINVTNLKRSDIQEISTYDYTNYKHKSGDWLDVSESETSDTIQFGESKTYSNIHYPQMWNDNDKNWDYEYKNEIVAAVGDKECIIWEKIGSGNGKMNGKMTSNETSLTFKQSYYNHNYNEKEFKNQEYYDLIFKDKSSEDRFWLAGRCVGLGNTFCMFGVNLIYSDSSYLGGGELFGSIGTDSTLCYKLRPIVSIDMKSSGCKITKEEKDGEVTFKLNWK